MACITFTAPWAMATTQLTRVIRYEDVSTNQTETRAECSVLRMNWVVATDQEGRTRLQMQWKPSASIPPTALGDHRE